MHRSVVGASAAPRPTNAAAVLWLALPVQCPRCGSPPALRITAAAAQQTAGLPADAPICSYKCRRKGCVTIYEIVAAAFQRAASRP